MRSSSTRRSRMAEEHSGSSRAPAGRSRDNRRHARPAPRHPALVPRPGRDGAAVHPPRRRPARRRLLAARPDAAAPGRSRDRPGPGRLRRVRQALRADPEGERRRGAPEEDRRRGREHRPPAPAGRRGRHRLRAGRRRRRPAAGERRQRRRRRRPGLARQPVLRAGLAVLSQRLGPAAAQGARADEPRAARRLARQHRRARQRRSQPDAHG